MFLTLYSTDDNYLSYRLNQTINDVTKKQFGDVLIYSKFDLTDNVEYQTAVYDKPENCFTRYSLYCISSLFHFALCRKYSAILDEYYMDYHSYTIEIGPYNKQLPTHFIELCTSLHLDIFINDNTITIHTDDQQFNTFIQQVFILAWCVADKSERLAENPFIRFRKYLGKWYKRLSHHNKRYINRYLNYRNEFVDLFLEKQSEKVVYTKTIDIKSTLETIIAQTDINSIVDLYCGEGDLLYHLIKHNKEYKIIGLEVSNYLAIRARKNKRVISNAAYKGLKVLNTNPLYPILDSYKPVDLLILSQPVYDNLLFERVADYYKPTYILAHSEQLGFLQSKLALKEIIFFSETIFLAKLDQNSFLEVSLWQKQLNNLYSYRDQLICNKGFCDARFNNVFAPSLIEYKGTQIDKIGLYLLQKETAELIAFNDSNKELYIAYYLGLEAETINRIVVEN